MTGRDYISAMATELDAVTQAAELVPAIAAQKLHAQMAEKDPDLLSGWLHAVAEHLLTDEITYRLRRDRQTARTRAQSRAFAKAVRDGGGGALGMFSIMHRVSADDLQRRAAEMTGADHRFVAADYRGTAKPLLMLAAFHEAVAKRVGKRKTADVMTEEKYDELFRSITGTPKDAAA